MNSKARIRAGEGIGFDVRIDANPEQIAMTMMHGDQRELAIKNANARPRLLL